MSHRKADEKMFLDSRLITHHPSFFSFVSVLSSKNIIKKVDD